MKIVEGVEYLSTQEVRDEFDGASKKRFYDNIKPYLKIFHFDAKKTNWYRKSDVVGLKVGKPVRKAHIAIGGIFKDWTQHLASLGFQASTELNSIKTDVPLPEEATEFLGVTTDKKFIKRSRHTLADGVPICLWSSFYPMELAGDAFDQMAHNMNFDVVEYIKDKHNVVINWSVEETTARITNMEELNFFRLPTDEAALILLRVSYTGNKEIVLFSSMVLLANWFTIHKEYHVDIWDSKKPV